MACVRCGAELPAGAQYCPQCGLAAAGPPPSAPPTAGASPGFPAPTAILPVYGGFWRRVLASIIDNLVLNVAAVPLVLPLLPFITPEQVEPDPATFGLFALLVLGVMSGSLLLWWLYFALLESSRAQATLGKRAMGLRVCDLDGRRIGFGRASGRCFARILSGMVLGLGYLLAAFTAKRQTLHDLIAGTVVVRSDA